MDDAIVDDAIHAFHEAGHVVVATALGTTVERATLDEVWTLVEDGCPRAHRNQAIIALAGAAAEIRHGGLGLDRQAVLWNDSWASDLGSAVRHLDHLDRAAIAPALHQARQLVTEHWRSVRVVALALLESRELTGADIHALIGSRRTPARAASCSTATGGKPRFTKARRA